MFSEEVLVNCNTILKSWHLGRNDFLIRKYALNRTKHSTVETKNIVFIAKSLDGYIAGKNGELDWLHSVPNPENDDMGFMSLMEEVDAIVMGRVTFEIVCGFGGEWPYRKHVFVMNNRLSEVPETLSEKVTLLKGNPQAVLNTAFS